MVATHRSAVRIRQGALKFTIFHSMKTPKKKPKLRRAWVWAWSISAIPLTLLYVIFRYTALGIAYLLRLTLFFAPRCRPDESLGNPLSNLIENVVENDIH